MDSRQLEVLLAVDKAGSFSGAARDLHTVQSNVSSHLARLEKELGVTLVDRSRGALTTEGEVVASRARRIRGELDAIGPDLAALRDEIRGKVRLGLIGTVGRWLLPELLRKTSEEFPLIQLQVLGGTTTALAPSLLDGGLELALVNLPIADPAIASEELFNEARVLAVPADSDLAKQFADRDAPIDIEELVRLDVLVAPQGTAFRNEIDLAITELGLELTPRAEVDSMELLSSIVASGIANALLPASSLPPDGEIVAIPVAGLARRTVGLAWSRRFTPPAPTAKVVGLIREIVAAETAARPGLDLV